MSGTGGSKQPQPDIPCLAQSHAGAKAALTDACISARGSRPGSGPRRCESSPHGRLHFSTRLQTPPNGTRSPLMEEGSELHKLFASVRSFFVANVVLRKLQQLRQVFHSTSPLYDSPVAGAGASRAQVGFTFWGHCSACSDLTGREG